MTVVAIAADKGGVGKSTTARNISAEAALLGHRVLAIDADKQADLTQLFDVTPEAEKGLHVLLERQAPIQSHVVGNVRSNVDLIGSHPNLALADRVLLQRTRREFVLDSRLADIRHRYPLIVIDLGHSDMVSLNVLAIADVVVIPTTTAWLDAAHVQNMLEEVESVRRDLGLAPVTVIVSVWQRSPRSGIEKSGLSEIRRCFAPLLAPRLIPTTAKVQEASFERMSVREYRDQRALSRERAQLDTVVGAYEALTERILSATTQSVAV